eukprot:7358112-Pyramimonas_sp.AAC.2
MPVQVAGVFNLHWRNTQRYAVVSNASVGIVFGGAPYEAMERAGCRRGRGGVLRAQPLGLQGCAKICARRRAKRSRWGFGRAPYGAMERVKGRA